MDAGRILIVDGNSANLTALEAVLTPLDRTIVSADSGESALKELLRHDFAVVLLDVQLAGIDGLQTASLMRSRTRTRDIPIIFLTAFDSDFRQVARAYDLGVFDYIVKPFDSDVLRNKVAAFIRLYEQSEQLRGQAAELEQQRVALLDAHESSRLRDVFVGVLGHDLRNPLNVISMGIQLLHDAKDMPQRHRQTIDRVLRSAERMERLIGDVLDFTRGHLAGGIPVHRVPADLQLICRNIVRELEARYPQRVIAVAVDGATDGAWDVGRVEQIIANLVGNALEHCAVDPVQVWIDGGAELMRLSVRNSGCIPEEVVPRLFEPFRRGDLSSDGLGLGLYIVREIARAHGGCVRLRVDRARNETTFIVELPRNGDASAHG